MKNVTVSMDEELARWIRVRAAEEQISVSRFLALLVRERMEHGRAYEAAKRHSLSLRPVALKHDGAYPTREEIHDRPVLRR